jgi:hypothetical protein
MQALDGSTHGMRGVAEDVVLAEAVAVTLVTVQGVRN